MASVFFMQPLGQIAGNLVSIIVIAIGRSSNTNDVVSRVDSMWRWVLGIGVIPGAIATLFRFAIPESPRYLVDIEDDPVTAEFDATTLFSEPPQSPGFEMGGFGTLTSITGSGIHMPPVSSLRSNSGNDEDDFGALPPATLNSHWRLAKTDIVRYFWTEGNWRSLVATSAAWLLMDFGFYGISLASPQFLARTWGHLDISKPQPYWKISENPNFSVYQMFFDTSVRALVILNIGSFAGGLLFIIFAHRIDRVALQKFMFVLLAALFIALGSMFVCLIDNPAAVVALYILGQIMFNFGKFTSLDCKAILLTMPRAQCNNLYDPSRNISDSLSCHLLRYCCCFRKAWLYSCPSLFSILQIRRRSRRPINPPPRHCTFRFQCLYAYRRSRYTLLDSFPSTKKWP